MHKKKKKKKENGGKESFQAVNILKKQRKQIEILS